MKSLKRPSAVADYLLDSNVLILHLRERPEITALLTRWGVGGALCISVVTRTEILAGMRPREEERTTELLDSPENLPVAEAVVDRAGRLIYQYARQGGPALSARCRHRRRSPAPRPHAGHNQSPTFPHA